jgi:hypothetical protein
MCERVREVEESVGVFVAWCDKSWSPRVSSIYSHSQSDINAGEKNPALSLLQATSYV